MPASGGPTSTSAPVTPGIRWHPLHPYCDSAERPRSASPGALPAGAASSIPQRSPRFDAISCRYADRRQLRQTLDERDERPDVAVGELKFPRRHAAHRDAIARDPVELARFPAHQSRRPAGRAAAAFRARCRFAPHSARHDTARSDADSTQLRARTIQVCPVPAARCRARAGAPTAALSFRAANRPPACAASSLRCCRQPLQTKRRRADRGNDQRRPTAQREFYSLPVQVSVE